MTARTHIAAQCGLIGLVIFYGSVLVAVALSPSFRWTANSLSDLGAVGAPVAWMFNGGLILSGLFFLVFAYGVFVDSTHWVESLGALVIAIMYFLSILVGLFPVPHPLHDVLAVMVFLLTPVGLWIYGTGNVVRGVRGLGVLTIGLGLVIPVAIVGLFTVVAEGPSGVALPELGATVVFDIWVVLTVRRLY